MTLTLIIDSQMFQSFNQLSLSFFLLSIIVFNVIYAKELMFVNVECSFKRSAETNDLIILIRQRLLRLRL